MKTKIDTLVCSGGGIKGISYIGVLKAIKEFKNENEDFFDIKTICCVSVGGIFALLYILNYDPDDLEKEVLELDFMNFLKIKIENLITKYGVDSGKRIIQWVENLLIKKNIKKNITFEEFYKLNNIHLKILATNLNSYKLTTFDYINTPKLKIIKAIKMSISLPMIFTAETYKNNIYIDGAVIDNYPIHLYDDNLENVLGIKLLWQGVEDDDYNEKKINSFDDFLISAFSCFMLQKDKYNLMKNNYKDHSIFIYSEGERETLNFAISNEKKIKMMNSGYNYTKQFFEKHFKKTIDEIT